MAWDYLVQQFDYLPRGPGATEAPLKALGQEGWELVMILHIDQQLVAYLKRLKQKD